MIETSKRKPTSGPCWVFRNTAGAYTVQTVRDEDIDCSQERLDIMRRNGYGATLVSGIGDQTEERTRGNEKENADLISEAFNIYKKTGLTPIEMWVKLRAFWSRKNE